MQSFIASLSVTAKSVGPAVKTKRMTNSTQTGKAVSRIRWLQESDSPLTVCDSLATEYFVMGNSGNMTDNAISLWKLSVEGSRMGPKQSYLNCIEEQDISGNVAGMTALGRDRFAVNTYLGDLMMFKCVSNNYDQEDPNCITSVFNKKLHCIGKNKVSCPATALVSKGTSMVSVGEDGSIFQVSAVTEQTLRTMEHVDSLSIYSVAVTGEGEIVTGNSAGQLKVWDIRGSSLKPVHTMNSNVLLNSLYGAISIAQHPSQSHCLLVGYQSGCLDVWDIRQGSGCSPIANLTNNTAGSLSEIYFHGINPDHFYACSQSGDLTHWFPADNIEDETMMPENVEYGRDLNLEFLTRGITSEEIYSASLPINSLSLSRNDRLICGGESGIVYCTEIKGV